MTQTEWVLNEVPASLTLRDYFAAKAMEAYWNDPNVASEHKTAAAWAYEMADAMLEEREK